MNANNDLSPIDQISRIFRAISSAARVQILAAIGLGEACVCHLEAQLGLRQAYISQQLMEMRDANLLTTRREGRFIYYRLTQPEFLDTIRTTGEIFDISLGDFDQLIQANTINGCCCPACSQPSAAVPITPNQISIGEKE